MLTISLPWVTETEFLLQNQGDGWGEYRKKLTRGLSFAPTRNSQNKIGEKYEAGGKENFHWDIGNEWVK